MALLKYDTSSQAWKDVESLVKYDTSAKAWTDCEVALKHDGTAWTEVWSGKYYIVKNGVIIDTSILDTASEGNIVSGTFGAYSESGSNSVTLKGTVLKNTLTEFILQSTNVDHSAGLHYAQVVLKLSYFGFVPPIGYTKLIIKGTYSNVNNSSTTLRGYYSAFSYADTNFATWRQSTMATNERKIYDGAFEEIIDMSNMSQVYVLWCLYGSGMSTQFNISLKITDMYFE